MYSQQQQQQGPEAPGTGGWGQSPPPEGPGAVEVMGIDANVSLAQLRQLFSSHAPVLQLIAALSGAAQQGGGSEQQGLALIIYSTRQAAAEAVALLDHYPLGSSFLSVRPADNLPGDLVNLLWSLEQPTEQQRQEAEAADAARAAATTAAYLREQQQQFLQDQQRQRQQQAWDSAQQDQEAAAARQAAARSGNWSLGQGGGAAAAAGRQPTNGHDAGGQGNSVFAAALQQQQQQLVAAQQQLAAAQQQLASDMRSMQLDRQLDQQRMKNEATAAVHAAAMAQVQQHRGGAGASWASTVAAPPPPTVAAALAAAHAGGSSSGGTSEDWQTAGARGRPARRPGSHPERQSGSVERVGSSVSSGSPHASTRGRRSDDKVARPGGQDGASPDPTTKLWMGGVDGSATAETVRAVFGRFGPIYDYELQPATHEKGRTDQWGFVNFKKLADATRAYEQLVGEVIPELTGTRKLKLQFRPVDARRSGTGGAIRR